MKQITRRRVENTIKNKRIDVKHFEAEYEGRGVVVKHAHLDQINWSKVKSITIVYSQAQLVYKGYYEGGGDYNNAAPF